MPGQYAMWLKRVLYTVGVVALTLTALSACGGQPGNTTGNQPKNPIKIGISVSLSGDFSSDGKAIEQGYQLWAADINKRGGLLGRQVQLDILSDASSPQQVVTNYQKLINSDHVDLVFGPFSTLLTKPASVVVNRYKYAMLEGAGGGLSVFNRGLRNVFDVSLPVANNLVSFTQYVLSLPASQRPQSAAYATQDDPFTQPQVDLARQLLEKAGVRTAFYTVYPAETTDYTPISNKIISSGAQIVICGTLLPDITAFIQAFRQQHYNPQAIIATAGPDQGTQFVKAVGAPSTEGIMVPNGWYPGVNTPGNAAMVQAYIAQYGGTPDGISSDVPEAYSVGQVAEQAIKKNNSLDNTMLINTLHSGMTFTTVQGAVKFDSTGQNIAAQAYLFQWQKGSLIPVYPSDLAKSPPEYPKAKWPNS